MAILNGIFHVTTTPTLIVSPLPVASILAVTNSGPNNATVALVPPSSQPLLPSVGVLVSNTAALEVPIGTTVTVVSAGAASGGSWQLVVPG